jgi:RNA polymerase sigma factor (sigma-70 family)
VRGASLADIERAYRERLGSYRRVAAAICGDREAAGDIVQEAFARAVRERRRFRGDATVETWLWRIVVNTARNQVRDRPRVEPLGEVPAPEAALSELGDAVATLPERQRLVVFLRYYADLDYAAIADVAGIAPGTVGAALNAARATLEERLGRVGARS